MEIKARISNRGKAKTFTVVENLPQSGAKVDGSEYFYGYCAEVELASVQRLKDEIYHKDYDFYILPVIDKDGAVIENKYYCCPHKRKYYATTNLYQTCISESRKYDNRDEYISHMYASKIWDIEDVRREGREEWLGQIWDATHRNMKDIIAITKSSQLKMCKYFGIPRRTLEDWCSGAYNPPPYILIMIQEILGLITRC